MCYVKTVQVGAVIVQLRLPNAELKKRVRQSLCGRDIAVNLRSPAAVRNLANGMPTRALKSAN